MTRPWRIALGVIAAIVVVNLVLAAIGSLTGGSPGGPQSSSYATGEDGLAAYAELLGRSGHPVTRLRSYPHESSLDPGSTVVVLDPPFVSRRDGQALRRFVERGGRLIAGGWEPGWLPYLVRPAPRWNSFDLVDLARPIAPVPELAGVRRVATSISGGGWVSAGATLPVLGSHFASLLNVAQLGRGRLLLLADASPLQNGGLPLEDAAALGLNLAGPRGRPVVFVEAYHGYGRSSGLDGIPGRWLVALLGLGLAALVYLVARGRRLGPPERAERELAPPRRAYVEALGGILARTKQRADAVEPVRRYVRDALTPRVAAGGATSSELLWKAAETAGLDEHERRAVLEGVHNDADVLAAGRALARMRATTRGGV